MKYCSKCGKQLLDEAVVCVGCGCLVGEIPKSRNSSDDEISIGLCILSFFFPIFGIIYWPVKHSQTPKKAMACGIVAIVSIVMGIAMFEAFMSMMLRLSGV